jgi:HD-like signal output (HDOD) protein
MTGVDMEMTSRRVLFVEPDEGQKKIYSAVLKPEENGWELTFASNAADALELNRNNPFDIVVSVSQLPDQGGSELLESLKETAPQTIRFLLIDESEKHAFRSLVSSSQQVLIKPIELKPFVTQINAALALRKLVHDPAILNLLGGADTLPPLPRVFQELTLKLNNPNTSLADVAELISQDIVLSSKILKMANSAMFNLREPAQNVTHAVSLLGSSAVSTLVFSQGMYVSFKRDAESEAFIEELNRHSIECAALTAKILSSWRVGQDIIEKAVFCGIAHDLGKLVLAKYAPEKWAQVLSELEKGEKSEVELERSVIGISHADVTAYLLAAWGFPNDQIIAIAFHHEPSRICETERGLLCALHIAENCCARQVQKEYFDHNYLEANHITKEDIATFKAIYEDECCV